ncbi:hypothetical protein ACIOZL_15695 [Streptomyces sp. NPDC087769]
MAATGEPLPPRTPERDRLTTVHSLDLRQTGATAHFELRAHPE